MREMAKNDLLISGTTIESSGSTSLHESGSNYFFNLRAGRRSSSAMAGRLL